MAFGLMVHFMKRGLVLLGGLSGPEGQSRVVNRCIVDNIASGNSSNVHLSVMQEMDSRCIDPHRNELSPAKKKIQTSSTFRVAGITIYRRSYLPTQTP